MWWRSSASSAPSISPSGSEVADARAAARALVDARLQRRRLPMLTGDLAPADSAAGYSIQAEHQRLLQAECEAGPAVGYKIGCTNKTAQAQLGIDSPFVGRLYAAYVYESPAAIAADLCFMRMIEAEVAFRVARDLPPKSGGYAPDELLVAVDQAMPALEIVDSRYADRTTAGAPLIIADNASAGLWVHGAPGETDGIDWSDHPVQVYRNGAPAESGNTGNVLGSPLNAFAWLTAFLAERGETLPAGQYVTTGTTIPVNGAEAGDTIRADFGTLGSVEVSFA